MPNANSWSIRNVQLLRAMPFAIATATIVFSPAAFATGTAAGTTISNTATATYTDPGGNPQTANSNQVDIKVDELLNVTVATADPGPVAVAPGSTNRVVSFTVTNTGNGSEAFDLTATTTIGGDQFDPTATSIVIDTNGNGVYDAGVDTVHVAGTNDLTLTPDQSQRVFVLSTIPGGSVDLDRGDLDLTAAARTGTGAAGTIFAGQGQGGGDAVVGTTGADGTDRSAYVIQTATMTFLKSASVLDPFGGSKSVPGAVVTYTLVATASGTGSLANLAVGDAVPANTTYEPGTITLQGAPLTDAADADAGVFAANAISVQLGSLAGGQTRTVTFKVRIN
jgi:uncharacterized repeat protein (TIGR01451 family)